MAGGHLNAAGLLSVMERFGEVLNSHQEALNQLNVYPVPDGDTGTNMTLTVQSVVAEIRSTADADNDLPAVCRAISHGSLMGARGNSGVILSQILRGLADTFAESGSVGPSVLATALRRASLAADAAVETPVEGTILTVARDVATAAEQAAAATSDFIVMTEQCLQVGRASLERTPELLPALAQAGVVDAGGAGFLLLLDALASTLDGRPLPAAPELDQTVGVAQAETPDGAQAGDEDGPRYEVMFFLEAGDEKVDTFRRGWGELGESIVVVGGEGLWNCHIHTDHIGAAIETGITAGRPYDIRVTDLYEQVQHLESFGLPDATQPTERVPTAVVAVATGDGVSRILQSLGVGWVVPGGQSMNPSTEDLVHAVQQLNANEVVLLPNNKNIIPVAEQVDACTDIPVRVVPTRAVAEGFAALVAYDPAVGAQENQSAMTEAACRVQAGEVTQAVRDSQSEIGPIVAGDYLGLDRQGLRVVAPSTTEATTGLLDLLIGTEHELVTLIWGSDATNEEVEAVVGWLGEHHPDVHVEVHEGGQPLYPFYCCVE